MGETHDRAEALRFVIWEHEASDFQIRPPQPMTKAGSFRSGFPRLGLDTAPTWSSDASKGGIRIYHGASRKKCKTGKPPGSVPRMGLGSSILRTLISHSVIGFVCFVSLAACEGGGGWTKCYLLNVGNATYAGDGNIRYRVIGTSPLTVQHRWTSYPQGVGIRKDAVQVIKPGERVLCQRDDSSHEVIEQDAGNGG